MTMKSFSPKPMRGGADFKTCLHIKKKVAIIPERDFFKKIQSLFRQGIPDREKRKKCKVFSDREFQTGKT